MKFLLVAKCCKIRFVRQKDESALLLVALWVGKDGGKFKSFYRNSIPTISSSIKTFYTFSLMGVTYAWIQKNNTPNLQCIEVHDQFLENFLPYIFWHCSTAVLHKQILFKHLNTVTVKATSLWAVYNTHKIQTGKIKCYVNKSIII